MSECVVSQDGLLKLDKNLEETYYFDYSSAQVQKYLQGVDRSLSEKELAVVLYNKVRDDWRYNAYVFHTAKADMRASAIIQRKEGHCLDKSIILASCFRAVGLPARLHLVKVVNHIAVERIVELFGTDELTPHGYVEVFLNGRWLGCTPAFNKALCNLLNVEPLEFDGENDSMFQSFDKSKGKFMEYLDDYGTFDDYPYQFVLDNMDAHYPKFKSARAGSSTLSFG